MILVADSGSTKTNWALLQKDTAPSFFDTAGYNPYFIGSDEIVSALKECLPQDLDPAKIRAVHFYGAGCFDDKSPIIHSALRQLFPFASTFVGLDLLGSAKAVLGNAPGFVAILGTGSNSCLYDGTNITANIDSLGYLLGDEGSGCYIGKKLLGDYIRGYMPTAVRDEFFDYHHLSREALMDKVYSSKYPSRYCASFAPFLESSSADTSYTRDLVSSAFTDFFTNLVTRYADYDRYTFNCTGSVAFAFRDILKDVAAHHNMQWGAIVKSPIEGLVHYHTPANTMIQ